MATSLLVAHQADRAGRRKSLMVLLAAVTLLGLGLFGLAERLWAFLLLSALSGAAWAAIGPLGEALTLQELQGRGIAYGRIRLWGPLTFILAAVGTGRLIEQSGPQVVLGLLLGGVALTFVACLLLPETRTVGRPATPPRLAELFRLPGFWGFVFAAGLIQVSHAVYYGFATLHWRAAGHSEGLIGWLWAGGVLAEIALFASGNAGFRRLTPHRLLALAGGCTVVRWSLSALGTDLALLIPAQALHRASFGATYVATMHYLRDHTPAALHASAQAINASIGFALLFGLVTPIAGWLYGFAGGGAFWAMAVLALAGTALAVTLMPRADERPPGLDQ